MSVPVPAPRTLQIVESAKKPVPTPRKSIPIARTKKEQSPKAEPANEIKDGSPKENETTNFNTFTRRVRTLSTTSKQITGEIAGKVQEKKKAVIEGTRQSVRRITRRFTTAGLETASKQSEDDETRSEPVNDVFRSICFQSPIRNYENVPAFQNDSDSLSISTESDEVTSFPPPLHPPPPLREDSIYDQPQSLGSGSTTTSTSSGSVPQILPHNPCNYESVFPPYPYNSDSESCVDATSGTTDKNVATTRCESWNYYDAVSKNENIYNNVDNTPTLTARKTDAVDGPQHVEVRNSLYENHVVAVTPPPRLKRASKRATDSLIQQFDPLKTTTDYSNINDLKALEELLQGDLYGTSTNTGTYDNWSSSESEVEEYVNPPTPPMRFDSLPEEPAPAVTEKSKSNWFTTASDAATAATAVAPVSETKKPVGLRQRMSEVLKKAPDIVKGSGRQKDSVIGRPTLSPKGPVQQKGMLYKVTNGPVEDLFGEFTARWCILENGRFTCFSDNTSENVKENFSMDVILSVQTLLDQKFKYRYENNDLHCFELNVSGKTRGGHVYGTRSMSERHMWMQRIADSLTGRFGPKITSEYNRLGWAYIREGVSGQWAGAWVVLSNRALHYAVDNVAVKTIDLRKVRSISLHPLQDNESTPRTNDKGPNVLVDSCAGSLYLRMWTTRETKCWCHVIRTAAHSNGALLEQQQLTKNDVPVIVEKCINFIYAHGSMSEGVYRRAGSGATIMDILTQFRRDSWAVQLTIDKYSEHDVATALKRFFRDLPEPLLTISNRQYLYQVSLVKSTEEKIRMYKAIFDHFSPVAYKTVRRLLGHLHFINSQSKRNLMTVDNLAAVWGPTLMHCDDKDESLYGQKESSVVAQLITLYRSIFPENAEEIEQERLMLQVLERCARSPQGPVNTKASGDLRVWVYLYNKDGQTHNIALSPQKTAYEVCLELSAKVRLGVHELQLEEVVLNESLTRPIHHTEKVLDVVLRWGYWDESDRKDNCLVMSPISKYWEYIQEKPLPISGELKFADCKSKQLKPHMFEFTQAKLSYYKDKTCATKIASWNIEDILWYFGNEPKRSPQTKWTVTFITKAEHPNRTKASPWFGNVVAWSDPALRARWLAAMLKAEHPKDLTPPPQHVNLMSG